MAVFVNASVYDRHCSQTILSWTILDMMTVFPWATFTSMLFEIIMTACQRNMNSRKLEWDGPKKTSIPSIILLLQILCTCRHPDHCYDINFWKLPAFLRAMGKIWSSIHFL